MKLSLERYPEAGEPTEDWLMTRKKAFRRKGKRKRYNGGSDGADALKKRRLKKERKRARKKNSRKSITWSAVPNAPLSAIRY